MVGDYDGAAGEILFELCLQKLNGLSMERDCIGRTQFSMPQFGPKANPPEIGHRPAGLLHGRIRLVPAIETKIRPQGASKKTNVIQNPFIVIEEQSVGISGKLSELTRNPGYFTSIVLMVAADVDDGDMSERLKCPPGTMGSGIGIAGQYDDIAIRLCRLECFEFIM